jgi:hypothetical protein
VNCKEPNAGTYAELYAGLCAEPYECQFTGPCAEPCAEPCTRQYAGLCGPFEVAIFKV